MNRADRSLIVSRPQTAAQNETKGAQIDAIRPELG